MVSEGVGDVASPSWCRPPARGRRWPSSLAVGPAQSGTLARWAGYGGLLLGWLGGLRPLADIFFFCFFLFLFSVFYIRILIWFSILFCRIWI
jgi:hypothetical protein